jgi:hypothetical protein
VQKEGKMKTVEDDGWKIPDYMWEEMKLIIPKPVVNHQRLL